MTEFGLVQIVRNSICEIHVSGSHSSPRMTDSQVQAMAKESP
jgi:hypothetical protein